MEQRELTSPYTRPSKGNKTERVWELADEITRRRGRRAKRKEVVEAYVAEGGNMNTASTQFHYWNLKQDENALTRKAVASISLAGPVQLALEANGRVLIPLELRNAMGLTGEKHLFARLVDGELHLMSPAEAIKRAQQMVRQHIPAGVSLVDELLADRRRDAELE